MANDADLAILARIDSAHLALRRTLTPVESARLRERPTSGDWSPMENLRHLVFAEQHHFRTYLERGFRWSSVGLPPPNRTGERRLNTIGSDPGATVDDVFDAWTKVHEVVRTLAIENPGNLTKALNGNLAHLSLHAEAIERLLRG